MKRLPLLLAPALLLAACNGDPAPGTGGTTPGTGGDTTPPTVSLQAAPQGLTATGSVTLQATVADNVAVSGVTFYRGSLKLGEDSTAPYGWTDTVGAGENGTVTYRAVARDTAGNQAEAQASVAVNVVVSQPAGVPVSGGVLEGDLNAQTLTLDTRAWTGGAGNVVAVLGTVGGQTTSELLRTALGADGSFSLTLPPAPPTDRLTQAFGGNAVLLPGCSGPLTVSDPAARSATLSLQVSATKSGTIQPLTVSVSRNDLGVPVGLTAVSGSYVYVDRPVNVTGTQNCTNAGGLTSVNVNWTLASGWNKVSATLAGTIAGTGLTGTASLRSGSFPNNWVYSTAPAVLSP
ncbi:Ig-like domain-containing protein [Deinococcus hopiensis]|uniref:Ig-like domain (Group 3) n=1 Tax=Deinococcus hopiensis KR-140 TaxID=695939 RepID=A0A1W1VC82_9DEIO|nr:Ig-like domain-containing protein [Deinococcus hopiensis]SMB90574.1 hypothetical protein SAMN00790413_00817 [Deinococcus hopiensis KR-140]